MKHTKQDLTNMQALPWQRKVLITQTRIMEWFNAFNKYSILNSNTKKTRYVVSEKKPNLRKNESIVDVINGGQVYVSFSGGKDSTVLLHIARTMYPDIEAVFVDTGLEYPEIREFVKTWDNVTQLKPKMRFDEVIKRFGYPVIGKEIAQRIFTAKRDPTSARADKLFGRYTHKGKKTRYSQASKWAYLTNAPFGVSAYCCDVMKKYPLKEIKKKPIIGTMACESELRETKWLQNGCNSFEAKKQKSHPMSFWTEQDVLSYIRYCKLPICSVYGDIEITNEQESLLNNTPYKYRLTGCQRTGCMFCMFGVHLDTAPNRFQLMKTTHPKLYDYCMRPFDQGGLGIAVVLDYIGVKY